MYKQARFTHFRMISFNVHEIYIYGPKISESMMEMYVTINHQPSSSIQYPAPNTSYSDSVIPNPNYKSKTNGKYSAFIDFLWLGMKLIFILCIPNGHSFNWFSAILGSFRDVFMFICLHLYMHNA